MNKHIQIRNVPEGVYRKLKERAAGKGLSLSDYLRLELEKLVAFQSFQEMAGSKRPTVTEIFEEIRQQGPVKPKIPVADLVRRERESR